jgi:hypothetical protein
MVVDYFTVTDAGRIINPLTIHGQPVPGRNLRGLSPAFGS